MGIYVARGDVSDLQYTNQTVTKSGGEIHAQDMA